LKNLRKPNTFGKYPGELKGWRETVHQDPENPTCSIVCVDWNERQTRTWLYHVMKNCPTAQIITVPDIKLVPGCRSCGKMMALASEKLRRPDRFIFLDSDTIVLKDLAPVFDMMGDRHVGVSLKSTPDNTLLTHRRFGAYRRTIEGACKLFGKEANPIYYMSGMIVLKDSEPLVFAHGWANITGLIKGVSTSDYFYDEITLCLWLAFWFEEHEIWAIPPRVHDDGWLRRPQKPHPFEDIWVLHYHKELRLKNNELGDLIRG